jgi:diguanylate cyclase (GGDEF)-like protein
MGGDEFIVLVPDATKDVAMVVAQRLEVSLTAPFTLAKGQVTVRASIGVATGAAGRSTPDTLLREADAAMYRAKAIAKVATAR